MARSWIYQKPSDVAKLGEKRAPWYCAWRQDGRQRAKKCGLKTAAANYRDRIAADLTAGELGEPIKKAWDEYRQEYERRQALKLRPGSMTQVRVTLDHFERLIGKLPIRQVGAHHVEEYVAGRLAERPKNKPVSRATVNKELRTLRAFFREAVRLKYLKSAPSIVFLKELEKLPTYIDDAVFVKLYEGCRSARVPSEAGYTPEDWWRAYLIFLYLTGWRALEPLSLRRVDLDEQAGRVLLRAEHNKGGRDAWVPLHPMVLEHLARIRHFGEMLLPWSHGRRRLWDEFHAIQESAGVAKPDGSRFGFHDLRRGFATANADRMTTDALQVLMRHRSYSTTKRYVNLARQLHPAVANIAVPALPSVGSGRPS